MATEKTVHASIDAFTLTHAGSIPVIFDNQDDTSLSVGAISWIKQKVTFTKDKQCELGNTTRRKREGKVVIIIYVRKGIGSGARDDLYSVVKSFRSQLVGAAVFLNPEIMAQGDTENWNATAYQIPFYFYEP